MMEYKGYLASPEYDAEDKVFHGRVIGIRDVVTFAGCTVAELEQAFRDSVDDYLDFCKAQKQEPDKSYSGRLLVRMSPELHRTIEEMARVSRQSLNSYVVSLIERASSVPRPSRSKQKRQPRGDASAAATTHRSSGR